VHSFRFEATYDCPLSHMLALTREFDLLGTWNRMALDPDILAEPSIFANIVYTGVCFRRPCAHLPGSSAGDRLRSGVQEALETAAWHCCHHALDPTVCWGLDADSLAGL
jgi:hypothetical protein